MRGKIGLVVGLGVGYVLGTRAGRARYEQIKKQAQRVWELDAVQRQVEKAKDAAASGAMAVPRAVWTGVVKTVKAASGDKGTAGERLDAAMDEAEDAARDVRKAVD